MMHLYNDKTVGQENAPVQTETYSAGDNEEERVSEKTK